MDIGIELNLNKTDLDALEETNSGDVKKCFTEMISMWLGKSDPPPTWLAMITALREDTVGLQQLADQLQVRDSRDTVCSKNGLGFDTEKLSFPHIKSKAPGEHTGQLLEGRLRVETLDIMEAFRVLFL